MMTGARMGFSGEGLRGPCSWAIKSTFFTTMRDNRNGTYRVLVTQLNIYSLRMTSSKIYFVVIISPLLSRVDDLGSRYDFRDQIHTLTGVVVSAVSGASLDDFGVDEKISWQSGQRTIWKEYRADWMAEWMLGMFSVVVPLIYGKGEGNAFRQLKKGIEDTLSEERMSSRCHVDLATTCPSSNKTLTHSCLIMGVWR